MSEDLEWPAERLFSTVREIEKLLPSLEVDAAQTCSALSGTDVSTRMFQRLGGMWLVHLAHQIAAIRESGKPARRPTKLIIPNDSWTHHQLLVSDEGYREQVRWVCFGLTSTADLDGIPAEVGHVNSPRTSTFRRNIEHVLQRPWSSRQEVLVTHPYLKISRPRQLTAVVKSRRLIHWDDLSIPEYQPNNPNLKVRAGLIMSNTSTLLDMIRRALPILMPVAFAEDLGIHIHRLTKMSAQPRAMFSANGSQFYLPYQVLSSYWGERGTLVLSHQHGGHQGLDEVHAGEEYETRASDIHYTLGWRDERNNVRSLCTAMPTRSRVRHPSRLLLMTLAHTDTTYRLQPFCTPDHAQRCFEQTRQFLGRLGWPGYVVVRGGGRDVLESGLSSGMESEGFETSSTASATSSALVVHNYLGVSWLETLAMNVPTVCFIPNGIHRFRPSASWLVARLRSAGILHESGTDAAKFVNQLNGNPDAWWNSSEVQEARQAFVARYANFSDDWLQAWSEEFERLLAE